MSVSVNIEITDFKQRQAYICVQPKTLDFTYLDVNYDEQEIEMFTLIKIPTLHLFSEVIPKQTKLKFSAKGVEIKMKKVKNIFWSKPCIDPDTGEPMKYSWLKLAVEDQSDSDNEKDESMPETDRHVTHVQFKQVNPHVNKQLTC